MIDGELLNKFDSIEDLPISEEMLGAYLEGNLSTSERELVQNEIDSDLTLMNLSHSALNDYVDPNIFNDSPLIDSIELPLLIDEFQFTEYDSYLEFNPSLESTDTNVSFELPNFGDDSSCDLGIDITNDDITNE